MATYASSSGGYVLAVDDLVRDFQFRTIGGRPAIVLGIHGPHAARQGQHSAARTLYWISENLSPAD